MKIAYDLSLNTIIISVVVAIVGWLLKGVAWALAEVCKQLIETLIRTMSKVEVLESKINDILAMRGDVERIKTDLNTAFGKIRELEKVVPHSNGNGS